MSYFIGIDIAKDKFDCLWLRDIETFKIKTKVLANTPDGFKLLRQWFEKNITHNLSDIHVCMEATGVYHEALAYALHEMGIKVSVMNPAFIRDFAKSLGVKSKTDKKDSMVIARYCALMKPRLWQPEPRDIRVLKAMLVRLAALEKDMQRELNRLEKAQVSQASVDVIESIHIMTKGLKQEISRVQKQIDLHIDQNPDLKQNKEKLQSIPGIGEVVSREMLAVLLSRDFKRASQAAAFMGLVPKQCESGKMKGRTTLCKNGPGRLRAKLYMAAIVAKQHNPDIKAQYERLLLAGKTKMQALGAAMRKLVQICFGVIKHQCEYQPQLIK